MTSRCDAAHFCFHCASRAPIVFGTGEPCEPIPSESEISIEMVQREVQTMSRNMHGNMQELGALLDGVGDMGHELRTMRENMVNREAYVNLLRRLEQLEGGGGIPDAMVDVYGEHSSYTDGEDYDESDYFDDECLSE